MGPVAGQEWKRQYNNTERVDTAQVTPVAIRAPVKAETGQRYRRKTQGTKPVEKKHHVSGRETLLGIGTVRSVSL